MIDDQYKNKALVAYDTRYGNTEKIAAALGSGLGSSGVSVTITKVQLLTIESLAGFKLLCLGGPTEGFGASKPMKEFIGGIKGAGFADSCGFAFDTKLDSRFSGSAAKYIEGSLVGLGLRIVAPRESAIVSATRKGAAVSGAVLREGEVDRFVRIGQKVGVLFSRLENPLIA